MADEPKAELDPKPVVEGLEVLFEALAPKADGAEGFWAVPVFPNRKLGVEEPDFAPEPNILDVWVDERSEFVYRKS